MKTRKYFIIPCILVIVISISISRCKTPVETKEILTDTLTIVSTDDTTAQADTVKTVIHTIKTIADRIPSREPLTIIIKNLASPTAPLIVGIYNSKNKFLYKEGRLKEYTFVPKGNTLTANITDINYGEIAVVIYQDMNSNGKFDKNFIGMPTEGYCFSNNFKPAVKAPDYDDCKFNYDSTTKTVSMNLIK